MSETSEWAAKRWPPVPDVTKFPSPPMWATWLQFRNPSFKPHNTLAQAKNAVSNQLDNNQVMGLENGARVYEWVTDDLGDRWVERFYIAKGDRKDTHPFWKFKASAKKARGVTDAAVQKAIDSIMGER